MCSEPRQQLSPVQQNYFYKTEKHRPRVGAFALLRCAGVAWHVVRELEYPQAPEAVERVGHELETLGVDRLQTALALPVVVALPQERDRSLAGSELTLDLLGLRESLVQTQRVLLAQLSAALLEGEKGGGIYFRRGHGEPRGGRKVRKVECYGA